MSRSYNIVDRLMKENKRPTIQIDETHEYKINTSKNSVLMIKCIAQDEAIDDIDKIDKIIKCALGEAALEYIDSLDFSFKALTTIVQAIMAGISEKEMEELDQETESFRK